MAAHDKARKAKKKKKHRHVTSEIIVVDSSSDDEKHHKRGHKAARKKAKKKHKRAKKAKDTSSSSSSSSSDHDHSEKHPPKHRHKDVDKEPKKLRSSKEPRKTKEPDTARKSLQAKVEPRASAKPPLENQAAAGSATEIEAGPILSVPVVPPPTERHHHGVHPLTEVRFLERPLLAQIKDTLFIILTGGMFERDFEHVEGQERLLEYDKPRVNVMFVGGIIYGFQIFFFLFAGLVGLLFFTSGCRIELVLFLVIVGCINTLGSAVFCLLHSLPQAARIMLAIIWIADFVWLLLGLVFQLGLVTEWDQEIGDNAQLDDVVPKFFCPIIPYVLAMMTLITLCINAIVQFIIIALYCVEKNKK